MLRRESVPACYLRRDRTRRKGFRNDPPLDLGAPAPASDPPPWLRSVSYMIDHVCEPI